MAISDSPAHPPAPQQRPFLRLWLWPLVLGVLTLTGLVSALVSEGWGDVWSWLALGIPVAAMAWFACIARR
ncbi:MAG: hypothetical protein EOO33_04175 [Comamonadaceae bacterium]|nr:MAG: hypothetical protein EOO33_04175 [Comamonadaceae bacterium]